MTDLKEQLKARAAKRALKEQAEQPPVAEPQALTIYKPAKERQRHDCPSGAYLPETFRQLPHSKDAEMGVLGSILLAPSEIAPLCAKQITPDFFHIPGNKVIYESLIYFWREGEPCDLITLTQSLFDEGKLEQVGGASYVTSLFTVVPTSANAAYYIEILREKYIARRIIAACQMALERAYNQQDEIAETLSTVKTEFGRIDAVTNDDVEHFPLEDMMAYESEQDPDNLIGKRWICRGHTFMIVGGAGFGKSTFINQAAIYWGCGMPLFGLRPVRPLKFLILQAENDKGDVSEQFQGVMQGCLDGCRDFASWTNEQLIAVVKKNVVLKRIVSATAGKFLDLLESTLKEERPDIVIMDPLFSFAGFDLNNQEKASQFLREGLQPIAVRNNCAIGVIHHTGKPDKDSDAKSKWTELDFQYLGFGSSEIQNSFRSITVILPVSGVEKTFRMILSKRGHRAGALSLDEDCSKCGGHGRYLQGKGEHCDQCQGTGRAKATSIYISWSTNGIHWVQVPKPEVEETKKGRPSTFTVDQVLSELRSLAPCAPGNLQKHCASEAGIPKTTFYRLWEELKKDGRVKLGGETGTWEPTSSI